jgi:hypothetical protein
MKKITIVIALMLFMIVFVSCSIESSESTTSISTISTTQTEIIDYYPYSSLTFPNYSILNPIRYLSEDERGLKYNGWQDFGYSGEILTHPWPWTTYTYQMYSYYIRNDLQLLYSSISLPDKLEDIPQWITQSNQDGRRIIWYSMGSRLPEVITLLRTDLITSNNQINTFLRAEYTVEVNEIIEHWIIYFMEEDGIYSSYSVRVNEYYESVLITTSSMIQSYQKKVIE